ncbi:MAG: EamA family transporter [Caldilineaceae bacterium]
MDKKNFWSISSLVAACLLFGSSIIFAKLTFAQMPVAHAVLWWFVIASFCLSPIILFSPVRLQWQDAPRFFGVGLLGSTLTYLLQFAGFAQTSAAHGCLILGLAPCIYAVAAFFLNQERLQPSRWGLIVLSAVGVGLIAGEAREASQWRGDGLILLSLLTSVSSVLLNQRLLQRYPPLFATAYGFWFGLPTLLPIVFWVEGAPSLHLSSLVWLALLGQGALCIALAYGLWNFGVSHLLASQVGIYANLEPVVGAALGVMVLKEVLTTGTLIGGLLVIGAAVATALPDSPISSG